MLSSQSYVRSCKKKFLFSFQVINFLLTTEIIPLCLRIMETGKLLGPLWHAEHSDMAVVGSNLRKRITVEDKRLRNVVGSRTICLQFFNNF